MKQYSLFLLLFTLSLVAPAKDTTNSIYFESRSIDIKTLLGDPPANDSPTTLKEIDFILEKQKNRTPEEVARIQEAAKHLNIFLFKGVLGAWFTEKNIPQTKAFFETVGGNVYSVVDAGKKLWARPRPFKLDPRVHPPIELPKNDAYPSGHSTMGNLDAMILAELVPDLKSQILARGEQIGNDRVIAGVHYPSDVTAGHKLAETLFAHLMASPVFQADLAKAKAEIAAARAKP